MTASRRSVLVARVSRVLIYSVFPRETPAHKEGAWPGVAGRGLEWLGSGWAGPGRGWAGPGRARCPPGLQSPSHPGHLHQSSPHRNPRGPAPARWVSTSVSALSGNLILLHKPQLLSMILLIRGKSESLREFAARPVPVLTCVRGRGLPGASWCVSDVPAAVTSIFLRNR